MSVCTSVVKLENISEDIDMMLVTIDSDTKAYMIGNYADTLQFIGDEVIVSYRKDIYQGKIETFINTLTIPVKVNVLDRDTNFKLYSDVSDNNSTVCFADIQEGSIVYSAVVYCVDSMYESSPNSVWMTLKIRDKAGRIAKVRLFDYDTRDVSYRGMYVKMTLRRTMYGFVTQEIIPVPSDYPLNPEIDICRTYVENYFAGDSYMAELFSKTKLLDFMFGSIAEEQGYNMVRAAVELDILNSLKNDLKEIDFKAVSYALIMKYGYLTKSEKSEYSDTLKMWTFIFASRLPAELSKKVLLVLDKDAEITPERLIFNQVVALADSVIKIKKEV